MKRIIAALAIAGGVAISTSAFAAAPAPLFVQFSPSATKGALYWPDPALFSHPHVGVVVMHRNSNFMSHISTRELPARGIVVLGMNPRCDNNEAACAPWENNALDVRQGVAYLRNLPGITKVLLLGHSGGGPTMSFYQAVAQKGVGFCQNSTKLIKCSNDLAGLLPADGIILMDAHPGNGINAVRSLNPAVTNDEQILRNNNAPNIDRRLDPFRAENGYLPNSQTHYSGQFKQAAFKAQSDRMNTLIGEALDRLADINETGAGDAPFFVPMADNARLADIDLSIHHSTAQPRKLIKNGGTVVTQIVDSVRVANLTPDQAVGFGATMFLTVKSFLSVRAVRSTTSMDGIDWCSSNNSTNCNLQQVSVPLLVTTMGGHYFIRDSEIFFDMAASQDKDFYVIEGATHGGTPCTACTAVTGVSYSNATKNLFDLMRTWINARF
jgi:hypothetical protein